METIDTIQNGDIQHLRHPIAPISLSDSRGLVGGRGRLALNTDESQLYTNEHGQLCLMTPVEVIPQEMNEEGTPLTIDFEKMSIKHGTKTFQFPAAPNITGTAPITVENNEIGLNLSDSFVLEGSMGGTENETSSLALKYPIAITGHTTNNPSAPLTFNFQSGQIKRDRTIFPVKLNVDTMSCILTPRSPITMSRYSLKLFNVGGIAYLTGYVVFTPTAQINANEILISIKPSSDVLPSFFNTLISGISQYNSYVIGLTTYSLTEFSLKALITEIPANNQITLNFSHIIGKF